MLEAPKSFIMPDVNGMGTYSTRWKMKKLMPAQYSRTDLKMKSLESKIDTNRVEESVRLSS